MFPLQETDNLRETISFHILIFKTAASILAHCAEIHKYNFVLHAETAEQAQILTHEKELSQLLKAAA